MRRPLLAFAAATAALSGFAAQAQTASSQPVRTLSWPGKTPARVQPVAVVEMRGPASQSYIAPSQAPSPFTASSAIGTGAPRANRYSARSGASRLMAYTPPPVFQPAPVHVPPAAPRRATLPTHTAPVPMPRADRSEYGAPVIPNEVRPAAPVMAQPRPETRPETRSETRPETRGEAPPRPTPARVEAAPAKPSAPVRNAARPTTAEPAKVEAAVTPPAAPVAQAQAPAADRPFIRPPSSNGPRFYSVHREFGQTPDSALRSVPGGAPTERLPTGFFAGNAAPAEQEQADEEGQDDAESRNAAIRAEVKRQVAASPRKR